MQALPSSTGPKKGRTELERTKEKLLGISQKHNDVVINNVSHRQKIRELEDELFNLRDECQGLRERNIALLARCKRQSQQQQACHSAGGSGPESQVLLHLITTLLNATPALAQLRTQLEGAMAAATLPEASTSAAAADPAPFQHWTPKLNPPGIVKASVEPMGIDGVMEEEEDADVVDALSAPSQATQNLPIASSSSSSSLSSIASCTSSQSLDPKPVDEVVVSRSHSRASRAIRRSSGFVPPPVLPPLMVAGPSGPLGLSRSDTLDNLPDMDDEWEEDPPRAEPLAVASSLSVEDEVEQLIQHVPVRPVDIDLETSPPLLSVAGLSSTLSRPLSQPTSTESRSGVSGRQSVQPDATLKASSVSSSDRKQAATSKPFAANSAPSTSRGPPTLVTALATSTSSSASSSSSSATSSRTAKLALASGSSSNALNPSTTHRNAQLSLMSESVGTNVQRRPIASTSTAPAAAKPRPANGSSTSVNSTKPRPTVSALSNPAPLSTSRAGNLGPNPHAAAVNLPPYKGSLPSVKMKDVAEAMRAAVKASTPPPPSHAPLDPSTPMRALSIEPPTAPSSATSASTLDDDSQEVENGRRLGRARKSVNYKEPSLNTKMRNPVATKKPKRSSAVAGSKTGSLAGDEDEISHSLLRTQDASNPALVVPTSGIVRRKSVLLKRGAVPLAADEVAVEYELTSDDDEDRDVEAESTSASEQEDALIEDDQQATPRAIKVVTPAPRSSATVERRRESGALPTTVSRRTSHRFSVGVGG